MFRLIINSDISFHNDSGNLVDNGFQSFFTMFLVSCLKVFPMFSDDAFKCLFPMCYLKIFDF